MWSGLLGSAAGFTCLACAIILAIIVLASVFSSRFRGDLLRAAGTGGIGPFSFTGAAFIVVIGSLIAGMLWAARDAANLDDLNRQIARAQQDLNDAERETNDWKTKYEHLRDQYGLADIPTINEVDITVKTLTSEKNNEEPVCFEIEHDGTVLAREQCGGNETWKKWDHREFKLPLKRAILKTEYPNLIIRVEKTPVGEGSGTEWGVQFTAVGKLSDDSEIPLLRSPELMMGGNHAQSREFLPTEYERVRLTASTRYPSVYVGHNLVATGMIVDGQTYVPVRDLAGALGAQKVTPLLDEEKVVVARR